MAKDFYNELGYDLPEGVGEVKAESFEYYRHPAGIYQAVFGRLNPKYKDLNGQKCEAETPGAYISHFTVPLWLLKFLGTSSAPTNKTLLQLGDGKIIVPEIGQAAELYFPLLIAYAPKDQWKNHKLFQSFTITGHDNFRVIAQNPNKPTEKITNFKAFPAYYGTQCKLVLELGAKTQQPYCSSLELLQAPRIDTEIMHQLETDIQTIIDKEIADRQSSSNEPQTATFSQEAPSADALFGKEEDLGEYER